MKKHMSTVQGTAVMGVDIGSASSKCVILDGFAKLAAQVIISAGTGTSGPARAVDSALIEAGLNEKDIAFTVATGYGRNTFAGADERLSELSSHAKGAVWILPGVRTVIDIGGQDAKALSIAEYGAHSNFVMNDKCAAGTGRFLDVMARLFELDVSQLAGLDEKADGIIPVSSTCVVFAESEVISQLAKNAPIPNLIAGIHMSAASRAASLMKRAGITEPILMTGGVANNTGVVRALEQTLGMKVRTSPYSQLAGAIGAALFALERMKIIAVNHQP
jgi:predicted CoA-substrate-specific enzyme activase